MDRQTYIHTQKRLLEIAREVRELPLDDMVDAIRTTEAIAPIVDPVAWRHGAKNLEMIRQLAEAALEFKNAFPDISAVLEGALMADVGKGLPGAGFIGGFNPDEVVRETDDASGPGETLEAAKLRRSGGRAFPEREARQ